MQQGELKKRKTLEELYYAAYPKKHRLNSERTNYDLEEYDDEYDDDDADCFCTWNMISKKQ